MNQPTSRRAISLALLLVSAITFQSFSFMGVAYGQKVKTVKDAKPAKPIPTGQVTPSSPSVPSFAGGATKVDAFPDPNADGKADPGETITYTVTITNTGGTDATGVQFSDTIDPNTTLVNGSTTTTPIASPDAFNVIGNVRIQVPDGASDLLANDCDPDPVGGPCTNAGLTITTLAGDNSAPFAGTSTNGGQVTATTGDGSFQYNPAPGFAGQDTFTYTITDTSGKTDTGTVTLQVGNGTGTPGTNVIWFVDPNASAVGADGRLTNPFPCYTGVAASCFSQTAADDPGDTIFLYSGAHVGGYTLLNNQKLIGAGASASLTSLSGVTVPSFSDALPSTGGASPTMTTTNVNAVNIGVGNSNTLRGFTIGNVGTGTKIASGASFGTLTVGDSTTPDMTLNGTGQALNLSSGTLAATSAFSSVTTTSSSTSGLSLVAVGGTLALGSTTVSGNNNECMVISNSGANINFGNTSCTGGSNGVSISGAAGGTRTFGTLSVSGGSGNAYTQSNGGGNVTVNGAANLSSGAPDTIVIQNANGNTINFAGGATVNHTGAGGNGIQWSGTNSGSTLTFATLALTTSNGTGMNLAGGGTVNVTTAAGSSISSTGDATHNGAAIIANGIALGANFTTVSSTNNNFAGSTGVSLTNVTGTSGFGTGSISGSAGDAFFISGQNGSFTYNGTIASGSAHSVNITGKTGGTVSLGGAITDTDTGITLTTNTGATINFTGGLSVSTGTSPAFTATGGGTVSATQNNTSIVNTLTTTTGTALNVANTTIGASGLTFRSISANGATNGIILNTTGASGGLTVTGQATTAGSGGTIQNNVQGALFTSTNSLSLSNMNFTNPNSGNGTVTNVDSSSFNSAAQAGINMSSVSTVSFTNLNVNGNGGSGGVQVGINGQTISNMTIANSTVSGFGDAATEGDVKIFNLSGTCSITNSTFGFAAADTSAGEQLIDIRNNTGTLTLTATGNTFNDTRTSNFGGTQLQLTSVLTATITANVFNNDFLKAKTSGVETFARDTSTLNIDITDGGVGGNGNVFDRQGGLSRAVGLNAEDTAHLNFNVNRNSKIYGSGGPVVNVFGINTAVINGRINNNPDIQAGGVGAVGSAINIHPEDNSSAIVEVIGNTISQIGSDPGIFAFSHGDGGANHSATLDVTIQSNTVTIAGTGVAGNGVVGIDTRAGSNANDTIKTCVDVQSNAVTLGQPADDIAWLTREGSTTPNVSNLYLEGMVAGASNQARATNTWNGRSNTPMNSVLAFDAGSSAAYSVPPAGAPYNGVCRSPANPTAMLEMRPAPEYYVAKNSATMNAPISSSGHSEGQTMLGVAIATLLDVNNSTANLAPPQVGGGSSAGLRNLLHPIIGYTRNLNFLGNVENAAAKTEVSQPVAIAGVDHLSPRREVRGQRSDVSLNHARNLKLETRNSKLETATAPFAPPCLNDAGHVCVLIGTLRAGDSVTITFQVTVNNPYSGGPNVSNQGVISSNELGDVLTDDPAVGGSADPTLTPINSTDIRVNDAKQPEPPTGTSQMLFTVTLSQPAPGGGLSVNYATANGGGTPATGGASCGGSTDYVTTSGTATVTAGSKTATIPVTICSDGTAEGDETLLMNISSPSSGTIVDNQATGTITANTAGTFLISEFRTRGSAGAGDDFVEFYNNTNSPLTVAASDASAGYGLYKMGATCNDTPVLIGTIPNGTVIPARGHYLMVGSTYSLANYGGTGAAAGNLTLTADIEDDRNIAVFSTANVANIGSANRLDASGFNTNTGNVCDLMNEGTSLAPVGANDLEYAYFRKECDFVSGVPCPANGNPKDTNDNLADFMFADTQGTFISGIAQKLGAPGPENLTSPIRRDTSGVNVLLLDTSVASSANPNRSRSFTGVTNGTFGTLTVRRRVTNTTGGNVTRLRYRIIEMTTFPSPGGGMADLRVLTSTDEAGVGPINDAATCTASGAGSPPCTVTVRGTTLETPPAQPNGGGINSTVSSGTITLGTPLANGASINVRFVLGIQTTGTFRFYIIVEALP